MKKSLFIIFATVMIVMAAGCQTIQQSHSEPQSTIKETVSASPSEADSSTPVSGKVEFISFHSKPDVKLSLGMDFNEIKKLLDDNGLEYTYKDHIDQGYDEMTDEASAITVNDKDVGFSGETLVREYYLGFSKDGVLSYIIWTQASDVSDDMLPSYIAYEWMNRGEFPQYIACEHTDIFVFQIEGGYFTQTHFKLGELDGVNSVNNRLTLKNNAEAFPDKRIPNKAYQFGKAIEDGGLTGIGHEAAIKIAEERFGKTDKFGAAQSYTFKGFAMYDKILYYLIHRTQIVDGRSTIIAQIYISRDGEKVLTGNFDIIYDK